MAHRLFDLVIWGLSVCVSGENHHGLTWGGLPVRLSSVTNPEVGRLCSLEHSITHPAAREAVQRLGFPILGRDVSPLPEVRQTDVGFSSSPGERTLLVVECGPEKSLGLLLECNPKRWVTMTLHETFFLLPSLLKRLSGKPLLCGTRVSTALNKSFLHWKLHLIERCFISLGVYGPVKYYVAFIFFFLSSQLHYAEEQFIANSSA